MGRRYLSTRKPQRIKRIRNKIQNMVERGVPVSRFDHRWGRLDWPLDTILHRIETLGYSKLCYIEILLDDADRNHTLAINEAIAEIAYFVGRNRIPLEEVIVLASEICPPPTMREFEMRGINADKAIAEHRNNHASPFYVLRHPAWMPDWHYEWSFLRCLNLAQLELLTLQLQNKVNAQSSSAVLRWTNEPTKH